MSENNDLLTFHNLLAENTRLKSENKKLNQAYENAEKVATERLWEIRERRAENVQLKADNELLTAGKEFYIELSKTLSKQIKENDADKAKLRTNFFDSQSLLGDATVTINDLHAEVERLKAEKDGAYSERNKLVSALSKIYPSVIGRHQGENWDDDWRNVIYINIPVD